MRRAFGMISGVGLLMVGMMAHAQTAMPDRTDGAAFFAENCVACHGTEGRGDGPQAAGLADTPTDLTTLARDNGGTFVNGGIKSCHWGGVKVGHFGVRALERAALI